MRTIQMTLDNALVEAVDRIVKKLKTTRSAFARKALGEAIKQARIEMFEAKHKRGYERLPATEDLGGWECEQKWGDE